MLTDIQGMEDHLGDMDFKVAGTRQRSYRPSNGYQNRRTLTGTFSKEHWNKRGKPNGDPGQHGSHLKEPRKQLSPYAPKITTLQINPDKIRDVIGPSGRSDQ